MANRAAGTYEVDPVSRIEGHLGIKVTTNASGIITDARAHGNLWRGFENFLLGRDANDAITFVQRICGVCPVPHGMTSTYAVDTVLGYSEGHITFADDGTWGVPKKAVSIRNLVLGAEFLMSSITHFYHLAAPSYIQGPNMPPWTPYFNDSFYTEIDPVTASMRSHGKVAPVMGADGFSDGLWSTVIRSYVVALRIRRLTFEAGALFAGRMPMTSVLCGGGVTFDGTENLAARCTMFENIMKEIGLFVIQEYVPIALALSLLYPQYDNAHNVGGSLEIGSGLKRYLSWGAFPDSADTTTSAALDLKGGYLDLNGGGGDFTVATRAEVKSKFLAASGTTSVKAMLTEDIANSRYEVDTAHDSAAYGANTYAYPGNVSRTKPKRSNGYTYMKAPRWNQKSCEVGPMARMFVNGLFQDNVALATSLGAYYTAYVKTASGNSGLNPSMVSPDIAVALLKAGLATVRNAAVATNVILGMPAAHDFTWTEITTNLAPIKTILGLAPATSTKDTLVAVYTHADTVITGAITTHVLGLKAGASTMDRLRGRAIESLYLVQKMIGTFVPATSPTGWPGSFTSAGSWVAKLATQSADLGTSSTWKTKTIPTGIKQGFGGTEAPRGALMHQMTISAGKITKYQCIVPTTWNGSPLIGSAANKLDHGAIEAACIDAPLADLPKTFTSQDGTTTITAQGGVEVLRIAQSFDPCIACAIH